MKRSTKLAIVGCVLTFGGLIALAPFAVENYYRRQLRATLARYAAAGDPIDFKLYRTAPIPDDQNRGAQLIRLAKPIMDMPAEIKEIQDRLWEIAPPDGSPPLTPAEKKSVADVLRDNLPPDAELDAALALLQTDWPDPGLNGAIHHLQPLHRLAVALADDAHIAAEAGNSSRFALRIKQIMGVAEAAGSDTGMIGMFVQIGLDALAADRVIENPVPLSDHDTRHLIEALLDEPARIARFRAALEYERAMIVDNLLSPTSAIGTAPFTMRIYFARDGTAAAQVMTQLRDAAVAKSSSEADTFFQLAQSTYATSPSLIVSISPRFLETLRRSRTDRHLAAVALATRAYVAKNSRPPASLSDLVPDFLPILPLDPFDPADGPLLTTPNFQSVYSRSNNRIDNGGDLTPLPKKGSRTPVAWTAPDRGISFAASTSTRPSR